MENLGYWLCLQPGGKRAVFPVQKGDIPATVGWAGTLHCATRWKQDGKLPETPKFPTCPTTTTEPAMLAYAQRLAHWIWQKYYSRNAPDWRPLETIWGVLTQIDNMVYNLTEQPAPVPATKPPKCEDCAYSGDTCGIGTTRLEGSKCGPTGKLFKPRAETTTEPKPEKLAEQTIHKEGLDTSNPILRNALEALFPRTPQPAPEKPAGQTWTCPQCRAEVPKTHLVCPVCTEGLPRGMGRAPEKRITPRGQEQPKCAECVRLRAALEHIADRRTGNSTEALVQLAEVALGIPEQVGDWWAYCNLPLKQKISMRAKCEPKPAPEKPSGPPEPQPIVPPEGYRLIHADAPWRKGDLYQAYVDGAWRRRPHPSEAEIIQPRDGAPLARKIEPEPEKPASGHAGDCTFYSVPGQGHPAYGICTCGYGWRWFLAKNDDSQLYSRAFRDAQKLAAPPSDAPLAPGFDEWWDAHVGKLDATTRRYTAMAAWHASVSVAKSIPPSDDALVRAFVQGAHRRRQWAVVLGLKPQLDGDQWSVLWGDDIMDGVVGFGHTPVDAIEDFERAMNTKAPTPGRKS